MKPLHPLWLRIWHWVNTVIIVLLIVTGLELGFTDLHILPFQKAVLIHKVLGFAMIAGFLFWLVAAVLDGSLARCYRVRRRDLSGLARQARYYALGTFKGETDPFPTTAGEKFNPLKKLAYISIQLVFTPVVIVTGVLFSDILLFRQAIGFIGGLRVLDAVHVIAAYVFADFIVIHAYMATTGKTPLSRIREMFTGI